MITWNEIESIRQPFYARYVKRLYNALSRQVKPVIDMLDSVTDLDRFVESIPQVIDTDDTKEVIIDLYRKVGSRFAIFTRDNIKSQGVNINKKDLERDIWMEELETYVTMEKAVMFKLLGETTASEVTRLCQRYIKEGMENGLGIGEITKNIKQGLRKDYGKVKTWRARRIAVTEVGAAATYGTHKSAEATGLPLLKVWIPVPGIAKKERHAIIPGLGDQRPRMPDGLFDVNGVQMKYPQDPAGGPENVINCNCGYAHEVIGG